MKKVYFFIVIIAFALYSCNNISNKSVSEKLNAEELSKAVKSDTSFSSFYENLRKAVDDMDDIKKEKFRDVTYRRLFNYYKFLEDTAYWKPLYDNWNKEWQKNYSIYLPKADSILNYWTKYLEDKSLNNYVKIELAQIDKEYYEYIGDLKKVNLGFKLTPIQGPVEQIRFNYGFKAKINGDGKYYEKHNCISTTPFSLPTIRYWEVQYSDRDNFSGYNVETFLRDYNLYIQITNIRKDGVNLSIDDFAVPPEVSECFEDQKDYPSLFEFDKDKLIKDLISNNYIGKWDYESKKAIEIKENKDQLCFDLLKEL